ncbi:aminotransferase class III-fold pyridoxal phosphate-dependent enzyme [Panacibacter sp. DH6]|uniref:Aminotransferase class III-fold pyridoxal phosphate-dependent enzyme n=1 Tax=Panacibacter microcysteis TaxID=2793269 RepID=A0A931E8Q3_9BACT|nr:aminotransferase class III-fold pyridoxal phosphate-dependent enzyme [Panacibacter microcysteis]MBG9377360.1 aminotransferase class III-fold pyridoxal phosphate-dependent enzyme [Panacibacter microcysteis]
MNFAIATIQQLVKEHYGLDVEAKALTGEYEFNFLLTTTGGIKYIFKVAGDENSYDFFDAQVKIVAHLADTGVAEKLFTYIPNKQGGYITIYHTGNKYYYLRLLTYLEGEFWCNIPHHPDARYTDLGNFLGNMDRALQHFAHPAMHRYYVWDISNAADANRKLHCIKDHERRRMAGYFLLQFETEVLPLISTLRHAYVHHDANDTNILVHDNQVSGLIDFSDMVYTALINNLAVACTYAVMNHTDPLYAASLVVQGYHTAYPLTEQEVDILYYLIAARLCISVTQSAWNASIQTNNEHHFISEKPAWDLLYKLIRINPLKAQHSFRKACGFQPLINNEDYSSLLAERAAHVGRNLSISYRQKLKIVRGALQYLYDDKGNTYVDCVNNPSHAGHCHPVVVKRMQKQIATLNTNTRYLHDHIVDYAKKLTAKLPPSLSVCYFTNSGSEANDLAIRMARHFTGQKDIIVLDHAYHGTSTVAMEMSPYKFDSKGGFGKMPWIHKAQNPDTYRGPYKYADADAGKKYAADVQRITGELKQANKAPAAFICETLLGVGGQIPLPANYLPEVYKHIRNAGGVCIADEVQVGFGRIGDHFWGFELQDVIPDIVVMGKPIGNGHPLAAVVVTNEIADAFNNGLEYFNTFGGNPVSMAAGIAVLDVIESEQMQQHAKDTGEYLMNGLRQLMQQYTIIGDVRGHGLFIGAELVKDRTTLEPAIPEIDKVVEYVKSKGYLLSTDGPLHNVLKIKPPMPFNNNNADELLQYLGEAFSLL